MDNKNPNVQFRQPEKDIKTKKVNYSASYLALTVLAILVGRMVVHGICRGGVGGWAVRLGARQGGHAGEARQDLQTLGSVTAGGHPATRLQPAGQWGKGKVSLGLMWDSTGIQQAHYLRREGEGGRRE